MSGQLLRIFSGGLVINISNITNMVNITVDPFVRQVHCIYPEYTWIFLINLIFLTIPVWDINLWIYERFNLKSINNKSIDFIFSDRFFIRSLFWVDLFIVLYNYLIPILG